MFELKVTSHFSAAHQLRMVAAKCENLHGHNWRVDVCAAGQELNDAGVLVDFGEIKKHLTEVMNTLDHKFLNELPFLEGNPSSETIARYIAGVMSERVNTENIRVSRVRVWESDDACATYSPD